MLVLVAAAVQYRLVLRAQPEIRFFVVPGLVGAGFGFMIVALRRLLEMNRRFARELTRRQADILELNRNLEARVEERTRELSEKHEQLLRSQRLEVVSKLTGGIVHDLNNLLLVIRGSVDLARDARKPPELEEALSEIGDAAEKGQRFTRRLLDASSGMPDADWLPVEDVAHPLVSMLRRTFGPSYEVDLVVNDGACPVAVGPTEQILMNLLVNARDALEDGGRIVVELDSEVVDGRMHAILRVQDDGPGIPPGRRDRIFEPFYTTKPAGQATGLGLSTVRSLVDGLGGEIELHSSSEGATFVVRTPCPMEAGAPDSGGPVSR